MKIFTIFYFIVIGLAAFFLASPDTLLVILFITLGLGFPLMFLPALAFYLSGLWPAIFAWRKFKSPIVSGAIGFLTIVPMAILPSLLADHVASKDAKAKLQEDVVGRLEQPPRTIEFDIPIRFYGGPNEPLRDAICDHLCQTLLLGREVDAVRVATIGNNEKELHVVVYAYEERQSCPPAFADAESALPATKAAASFGKCIVPTLNGLVKPTVKLGRTETREGWDSTSQFLHRPQALTRFEVREFSDGKWHLLSRTSELKTKVLLKPLYPGFPESQGLKLIASWARREITFNAMTPFDIARSALGFRAMPLLEPVAEPPNVLINRILSASGTDPIGPELMSLINDHLGSIQNKKDLSAEDVDLLRRLVANDRVQDHFRVYLVMGRHPQLASGMIRDILRRLERPVDESVGHNHNHLSFILARAPIESLRPFGEEILSVASTSDEWPLSPLLRIVGQLDIDPSNLLKQRLSAESGTVRGSAAIGICTANEKWGRMLAPKLLGILEIYRGKSYGGNSELEVALRGLKKWGLGAEIEPFLLTMTEGDAQRLRHQLDRAEC